MENKLADIYNKLADKINITIPVDWDKLFYLGEVEKDKLSWSSIFYFVESESGNIIRSHDIPSVYSVSKQIYGKLLSELNSVLIELYECFEENERELWEQVCMTLDSSGGFNINFKYDVMNENDGGQVKREIVWAYETFNYVPEEGSFSKKILEEYLNES